MKMKSWGGHLLTPLVLAIIYLTPTCVDAATIPTSIKVIVSDASGKRLEEVEDVPWKEVSIGAVKDKKSGKSDNEMKVNLDTTTKYQKYDGMGGSFMRAGATLLNQMPKDVQDEILKDLFDKKEGIGIRLGKVPIGATDFGVPKWYTYADEPQSSDLPFFNMSYDMDDMQGFIPYVQRAVEVSGSPLRLEATMDYPPQWMLNSSTPLPTADLNTSTYEALANYYYKYCDTLHQLGLPVEVLALFNEAPDSYTAGSNQHMRDLLVDHVAPLFNGKYKDEHDGVSPKLTFTAKFGRAITLDDSPAFYELDGVQEVTDAIFYHGYDCNYGLADSMGWQCNGLEITCPHLKESAAAMRRFYEKYGKGRQLWMTEVCYASEFGDYNYSNGCPDLPRLDFEDSMQWGDMIFADFNIVQASGWIYWNMILDTSGGPWLVSEEHNDPDPNEQQPILVVDTAAGTYSRTGVYYAMAHFGRYIEPGSMRFEATIYDKYEHDVSASAFIDEASCSCVIVAMNKNTKDNQEVVLSLDGKYEASLVLSPISFTTLQFDYCTGT